MKKKTYRIEVFSETHKKFVSLFPFSGCSLRYCKGALTALDCFYPHDEYHLVCEDTGKIIDIAHAKGTPKPQ